MTERLLMGGPLNGRRLDIPRGTRHLRVPIAGPLTAAVADEEEALLQGGPTYRVVEYEPAPSGLPIMTVEERER